MAKIYHIIRLGLMVGAFSHIGCENNLRDVEKLTFPQPELTVDKSTDVEIIYSDNALIKAKITTPELLKYNTDRPYTEMKKGVIAVLFDEQQQESSRVVADYAINREKEKIVDLRNNVVVTNKEGKIFKSDELIWDQNRDRFYSNKLVTIITPSSTIYGTQFWANKDFTYYEIQASTGDINMSDK